jgi:hypothetical protein
MGFAVNSFGSLATFDLLNDSAVYSVLDNQMSASVTNGGLVATLTASDGVLNRTSLGFGVNGSGTDDTDGMNAGQYIDIVFNQDVSFESVNVSSWGTTDAGVVQLGPLYESQGSLAKGDCVFGFDVLTAGANSVRILATADSGATNGFSFNSFTVDTIPEPAAVGLLGLGAGFMLLTRKRKS